MGRNYAFLVAKALQEGLGCAVLTDPRFGWKHDFFLPLHEVCWRKADHLGNTDVYWAHKMISQTAAVSPQALSRLSRCAQMLRLLPCCALSLARTYASSAGLQSAAAAGGDDEDSIPPEVAAVVTLLFAAQVLGSGKPVAWLTCSRVYVVGPSAGG